MTSKQEFGIGLIGLGIGQQHLLGYQRQGLRVAAICDKDTERLNEVGERFQINQAIYPYHRPDCRCRC